jgi:glucosyl-dolichyl phosphate glucuronosyltransferase
MTEDWVIRRAYRFGRNQCYQDFAARDWRNSESSLRGLLNCPKWMLRRVMQDTVLGHLSMLRGDRCRSVARRWDAAFYRGYIVQAQEFKRLKTKPVGSQAPSSDAS